MNTLITITQWVADNIFSQPALMVGMIAVVGLIALRKSFSEILTGGVKTAVGFLIMAKGADIVVDALLEFTPILQSAFGMEGSLFDAFAGVGLGELMATHGGTAALIMTFGFVIHLLIARFTRAKYIYLTGHLMFWIAIVLVAVQLEANPGVTTTQMVVAGAIIIAIYWSLQPVLTQPFMRKITGGDELAYGHTSASTAWLSGVLGKIIGDPENSTEDMKLPGWLEFFRDITVATAVVISIVVVLAALFAGPENVNSGALNYIVFAALQGLTFAVGIAVLLAGVRMVLGEIIPAFRGIALRIVPGAKPALDAPIIFDFAPTAVLVGFLSAFVVFIICMLIFGAIGWAVIIPPMIMLFFPGGACGVFGNALGGVRGAILGGVILGLFLAFGQAITMPMLSNTAPALAQLADPDWYIIIWIFKPLFNLIYTIF
ncbi:MAG: PTS ascorbate transporter subunit IIC [Anaerolineales bacterium]|nr:PTS ascorbate transporter subunit IIC [Anaerolineales bacterium]